LINNFYKMKRFFGLGIIILISILPLLDFLHPGLPLTHDGQDHIARIANFYQSLTEGNLIPRWAGNLNWGYGHPILMFLYPLPSYSASLFHLFGVNFVDSLKIVFATTFILSGITMYLWIREFLGEEAGIIAGAFYMFAPYRLVDLYVRGALGEHVAFVFPPLICYFMFKLSKKYSFSNFAFAAFSVAFLVLSHNAITIMFMPFVLLYCVILLKNAKNLKKLLLLYFFAILLGVGISGFFLIPAFLEGKYTLRDIVTAKEYASRFVVPQALIYSQWSYGGTGLFSAQLGLLHFIGVVISIFSFKKVYQKNKIIKWLFFLTGIFFLFSIFIMLKESDFIWKIFTILQKFQFPWRFLSLSVFCESILAGIAIALMPKKHKMLGVLVIVVALLIVNKNYWHANGFLQKPENFYTKVYQGTTDTGESSPIWSIRFMEQEAPSHIQVIGGMAVSKEVIRTSVRHLYVLNVKSDSARIRENTLYFPGWNIYVDDKKTNTEFQDPNNRGVMTFFVPTGLHKIELRFEDTNTRKLSNIISVISLAGVFGIGLFFKTKYGRTI